VIRGEGGELGEEEKREEETNANALSIERKHQGQNAISWESAETFVSS